MLPYAGPAGPSLPAGATTSVSSASGSRGRPRRAGRPRTRRTARPARRGRRAPRRAHRRPRSGRRRPRAPRAPGRCGRRPRRPRWCRAASRRRGSGGGSRRAPRRAGPPGPPEPDDEARDLGAVALRPPGIRRILTRSRRRPGRARRSRGDAAAHVGVREVDAGVEERDGHALVRRAPGSGSRVAARCRARTPSCRAPCAPPPRRGRQPAPGRRPRRAGSRSTIGRSARIERAANPLTTRTYDCSGSIGAPRKASGQDRVVLGAARLRRPRLHLRLGRAAACRARPGRRASGGASTTIQRPPSCGGGPVAEQALPAGGVGRRRLPCSRSGAPRASAAAATSSRRRQRSRRIRIQGTGADRIEGWRVAPGGRDHGGVVGAQRERREGRVGERRRGAPSSRRPPDDGEPLEPVTSRPPAEPPTSAFTIARWYEAARSARRSCELVGLEVADGVEERGLQPGEREVEPRDARDREPERLGVALPREHGRSPRRPGSRARAGARPCRTPHRLRRRASCRATRSPRGRGPRGAACDRRSRAGRRRAARPAPARGRARRRARADGRRGRAGCRAPRRAPWPRRRRRAARRSARARA